MIKKILAISLSLLCLLSINITVYANANLAGTKINISSTQKQQPNLTIQLTDIYDLDKIVISLKNKENKSITKITFLKEKNFKNSAHLDTGKYTIIKIQGYKGNRESNDYKFLVKNISFTVTKQSTTGFINLKTGQTAKSAIIKNVILDQLPAYCLLIVLTLIYLYLKKREKERNNKRILKQKNLVHDLTNQKSLDQIEQENKLATSAYQSLLADAARSDSSENQSNNKSE